MMSVFQGACARLFSFVSSGTIPTPTPLDLKGYTHIKTACPHLLTTTEKVNKEILDALKSALNSIGTDESLLLAERFDKSRIVTIHDLYVPPRSGSTTHELRKSTLLDLHEFCSREILNQIHDESIRGPLHGFLAHFPLVVLHPDFIRPQETGARHHSFKPQPA